MPAASAVVKATDCSAGRKRANTFLYPYGAYLASRKEGISSIRRADADLQTYGYMASVGDSICSAGESVTQKGENVKVQYLLKDASRSRERTAAEAKLSESKPPDKRGTPAVSITAGDCSCPLWDGPNR